MDDLGALLLPGGRIAVRPVAIKYPSVSWSAVSPSNKRPSSKRAAPKTQARKRSGEPRAQASRPLAASGQARPLPATVSSPLPLPSAPESSAQLSEPSTDRSDAPQDGRWQVTSEAQGSPLDRWLRSQLPGSSWEKTRELIRRGKVQVNGEVWLDPLRRLEASQIVDLRRAAPRPETGIITQKQIAYLDAQVVVVRKPAGISSVPYENERDTLDLLLRALLSRIQPGRGSAPLGVVHRIDKETSGLLVFARTLSAKRHLEQQFRVHSVERRYLALAQGRVEGQTITSRLIADRGDGRRGSTQHPRLGQLATTHVRPIEHLGNATLIECQLETGRTHQIRIHLSEAGHPLLGDRVYGKPATDPQLTAPRLMLHATMLGFVHPSTEQMVRLEEPPPEDFAKVLQRLRQG